MVADDTDEETESQTGTHPQVTEQAHHGPDARVTLTGTVPPCCSFAQPLAWDLEEFGGLGLNESQKPLASFSFPSNREAGTSWWLDPGQARGPTKALSGAARGLQKRLSAHASIFSFLF